MIVVAHYCCQIRQRLKYIYHFSLFVEISEYIAGKDITFCFPFHIIQHAL